MGVILTIHGIFGERVLPLLIVLAAIWFTVTWKPNAAPNAITRLFPVLIDIQATLGLLYFVYLLVAGGAGRVLSFPFILHPILGLLAAGFAHMALKPGGRLSGLGRWSALVSCVVLLVFVIVNVMLARMA
jgi:hypothetical protein